MKTMNTRKIWNKLCINFLSSRNAVTHCQELGGKLVELCTFPASFYVSVTRVQDGQLWYSENKQGPQAAILILFQGLELGECGKV